MVSSQARRDQVALAMERGHSQRQACELMDLPRSMLNYRSVRAERDAPALDAMRRIAATYPRYGYRRVRIFLRREGHPMVHATGAIGSGNDAGLPSAAPPTAAAPSNSSTTPPPASHGPNQVWAYDFVHDACANGQKLKCLTLIDEFTHECLAIDVAGSLRSGRVIEVLTRLISARGAPMFLRSDNGPEFVSHAILSWLAEAKIETALIDPGKPWQNGDNESFNGKFRDECLSMEWFRSRKEAAVLIEIWRRHYNEVRPHSSLDYRTPIEFRRLHESTQQGAILK